MWKPQVPLISGQRSKQNNDGSSMVKTLELVMKFIKCSLDPQLPHPLLGVKSSCYKHFNNKKYPLYSAQFVEQLGTGALSSCTVVGEKGASIQVELSKPGETGLAQNQGKEGSERFIYIYI